MKSHSFMSCFLLTMTALWTAVPASAQESPEPPAEARSLAALTQDARIALRAEATLEAPEAWELAVRTLVALNDELRVHPKNREGSSFAKLKRSLHRRILKAQKKLAASGRQAASRTWRSVTQPTSQCQATRRCRGGARRRPR